MTAADHKIIIEKGADFKIDLRVTTDGVNAKPLVNIASGWTRIAYGSNGSGITERDTAFPTPVSGDWFIETANYIYIKVYKYTTSWDAGTTTDIQVFTPTMLIKYKGSDGIYYVKSDGTMSAVNVKEVIATGAITNALNGEFSVTIDQVVTEASTWKTDPLEGTADASSILTNNPFATEYNYFYNIDIDNSGTDENFRVLRGKCAVRL